MEAITATYTEHDEDWTVTVAGMGRELTEHAPGIIAARDHAEQLIDSLKPAEGETAVVHLLHGSALEFTTAYMIARLSRGNSGEGAGTADGSGSVAETTETAETAEPADSAQELAK